MDDQIIKIEHELNLSCVQICQFSRSLCEPHANRGLLTCSSKIFVNSRKFVFLNLAVISYPLSNLRILESSYICMDVSLAYYMKCSFCTWAVNNIPKQRRSNGISNGGVGLRNFGPFFFPNSILIINSCTSTVYFSSGHIKDPRNFPRRNSH